MKTLFVLLLVFLNTIGAKDTGDKVSSVSSHNSLPAWFLNCRHANIGISDPNLDTIVAYNQAVKRALAFYALNQNMELSSVYEYYYNNSNINGSYNNQKSHWIAEFETSLEKFSYEVNDVFYTKHNEIIVSINVDEDNKTSDNELDVIGSFMYHYDYINDKLEYGEKQLLSISTNDEYFAEMSWVSTVDNNNIVKMTYINELPLKLKTSVNYYEDNGNVNDDMVFVENKYGLWDCYIDSFFQAISNFEPNSIVLKNSTRQITQEDNGNYGDKSQDIMRRVIKTKVSCCLKSLSFKNGVMYADWEIIEK